MGGKPYISKTNRVHEMIKKYVTPNVRGGENFGRNTMGERINTGSRGDVNERGNSDVGHDQEHSGVSQSRRMHSKHSRKSGYGSDSGRNTMGEKFNTGLRRDVNERDSDVGDGRHHTGVPPRGKENRGGSVNRKYIERRTQQVQTRGGSEYGSDYGSSSQGNKRIKTSRRSGSIVGRRNSGINRSPK
jgi:hypothetical protein